MAHLRSLRDPKTIHPLELRGEEYVVGRRPECDLVIDEPSISRKHAAFTFDGSDYYIQDLEARNFTYLNGVKLDPKGPPQKLKDDDKVAFCEELYVFRTTDPKGGILFVDDDVESSNSTIMSKVGISSGHGALQLTASPEAKLNALLEINRSLGRALSLDEVLPQVLNSLFKIFVQADRGFIALQNADGTLVPRWSRAWREDATETIRVSRTIVNKVLETQEGILSADVMMDEEFNKAQSIADFRIRSMMCAPLIDSQGNSMGVLQIDTVKQSKRFQQEDLEVLLAVASQAGIAIDNAQMHELALRQRVIERDLELANEVQQGFLARESAGRHGLRVLRFLSTGQSGRWRLLRLPGAARRADRGDRGRCGGERRGSGSADGQALGGSAVLPGLGQERGPGHQYAQRAAVPAAPGSLCDGRAGDPRSRTARSVDRQCGAHGPDICARRTARCSSPAARKRACRWGSWKGWATRRRRCSWCRASR